MVLAWIGFSFWWIEHRILQCFITEQFKNQVILQILREAIEISIYSVTWWKYDGQWSINSWPIIEWNLFKLEIQCDYSGFPEELRTCPSRYQGNCHHHVHMHKDQWHHLQQFFQDLQVQGNQLLQFQVFPKFGRYFISF